MVLRLDLTARVLAVLTDEFTPTGLIAVRARLPTRRRVEMADRACWSLHKRGLAEGRFGRGCMHWRRAPAVLTSDS